MAEASDKASRSSTREESLEVLAPEDRARILRERVLPHIEELLAAEVQEGLRTGKGAGAARARLFDRVLGPVDKKGQEALPTIVLQFGRFDGTPAIQGTGVTPPPAIEVVPGEYRELGPEAPALPAPVDQQGAAPPVQLSVSRTGDPPTPGPRPRRKRPATPEVEAPKSEAAILV